MTSQNWSNAEDEVLRKHYSEGIAACFRRLEGRTKQAIRGRARRLGLKGLAESISKSNTPSCHQKPFPGQALSNMTWERRAAKARRAPVGKMEGEAIITKKTKVTVAPKFVDRRWTADGKVPKIVDSSACREWAKTWDLDQGT